MLRWIKGGRSDHPLDDKDAPGILLEKLSGKDPISALEQLSAYLDCVKTAEKLKPGRAFEIVDLLDRTGQPLYQRTTHEFLTGNHRLIELQQTRLWTAAYGYWSQIADGYRFCLAKYEAGAVGAAALKSNLPRIICRALRACAGQLKWTLLRYRPVDPHVWQNLGGLYLLAESLQFAQVSQPVYHGIKGESSPERELLRALILAVSSPDALQPLQIELADRMIAQLAAGLRIAPQTAKGFHYIFDVSGDQPPGRLPTQPMPTRRARCFGPGEAYARAKHLLQFIDQNQALPPDLALGNEFDLTLVQTTLQHLLRYWAPVLPERKQRRRRQTECVTVVHEYEEVLAYVGGLFLDSHLVSNDEEWVIENASEGGLGALVPHPDGAWVKIGILIGIRREDGVSWGVGIVRRVAVDEKANCYVGIQVLAHGGAAVTVMATSTSAKGGPNRLEGEVCVLLPSATVQTGEASLLMRAGLFSPAGNLLMRAYDRQYLLLPLGQVEKSEEFEVGRYRILGRVP